MYVDQSLAPPFFGSVIEVWRPLLLVVGFSSVRRSADLGPDAVKTLYRIAASDTLRL